MWDGQLRKKLEVVWCPTLTLVRLNISDASAKHVTSLICSELRTRPCKCSTNIFIYFILKCLLGHHQCSYYFSISSGILYVKSPSTNRLFLFFLNMLKCIVTLLHQKLEEELHNTWQELSGLQSHSSSLAAQLSSKEREVAVKETQLSQLRWALPMKALPRHLSARFPAPITS